MLIKNADALRPFGAQTVGIDNLYFMWSIPLIRQSYRSYTKMV